MLIQFHAFILGGHLTLPSAFVATHWRNVTKAISNIVEQPASHTVEVVFPIGVSKIMEYVGEDLDKRLVFDPQTLEILHLEEKDMLIFQCEESEENNMPLRVSACHSVFDMAMIDTRLDRAVNCFLQQIPFEYRDYIESIFDVPADGNCGYYCILDETEGVSGVPKTVEELRKSVSNELSNNYDLYKFALGIESKNQIEKFDEFIRRVVIPNSWMEVSECFIISTVLSIPILLLVPGGSCIYIPQRDPPEGAKGPMICMAHVNGNHFVRVKLKSEVLDLPKINDVYKLVGNRNEDWNKLYQEGGGIKAMMELNKATAVADEVVDRATADEVVNRATADEVVNRATLDDLEEKERSAVQNEFADLEGKDRSGVKKIQQIPQHPPRERRRRRRRNLDADPETIILSKRKRNKPKKYMTEASDVECLKPIKNKRTGKKKMVEKKTGSSEGSGSCSWNVKPKPRDHGKTRKGFSVDNDVWFDDGYQETDSDQTIVKEKQQEKQQEKQHSDKKLVKEKQQEKQHSDQKLVKEKQQEKQHSDQKLVKEKQQEKQQQQRSDSGTGSVATTKSERRRIEDTIQPMIEKLEQFVLHQEKMDAINPPQEVLKMKGKKGRDIKAKWIIRMLQSFV